MLNPLVRPLTTAKAAFSLFISLSFPLDLDRLSPKDAQHLEAILARLEAPLAARKVDGSINLLTFPELYGLLPKEDRLFLDLIRSIDPAGLGATAHRFPETQAEFVKIENQPVSVLKDGKSEPVGPQFLPKKVDEAYEAMMRAMEKDLGKRLYVESGYRSAAYQLYLFLFYLPKHNYSIRETNRFVALPEHSEHGAPSHQAIDFINRDGINGEDHPEEFEALP